MQTPGTARPSSRFWSLTLLTIAAAILWRVAMSALMPVTQDEAYYFDWARTLAWGYFDHPPGVALLGLGTLLVPGSAFAARFGALLAGILTLLVLARFYRHCGLSDDRQQALALLLVGVTLPGLAGGVITTPDSLLMLAWALALHESERALTQDRRRWLSAGLAVGIGLLGKYTMVLIGPVLLWAILRADPRALRTPWPYAGGVLALLVFAPNLWWNAQHEWLTLGFQFGHGFSTSVVTGAEPALQAIDHRGPATLAERALSVGGYLGVQALLWGVLLVPLLAAFWPRRQPADAAPAPPIILTAAARPLLLAATLFPLGFFAVVAAISEVEANWPIMYLLSAPPLAVLVLRRRLAWTLWAAAVNVLLVSLYVIHAATAALPLPDQANRVLRETHGFAELAAHAARLEGPVHADRYQTVAMLRFHQPTLAIGQWPGLTRPSEYLRGAIAPRVEPDQLVSPVWLIHRFPHPPALAGFTHLERRTLHDCLGQPLVEGSHPPCESPLRTWFFDRYTPAQ